MSGLPDSITDGVDYDLEVAGDLTVKSTAAPEVFVGTVRLDRDRLSASMTASVLMSTYEVGPISVSGLVSTSDTVEVTFDLVAQRTDPDEESGALDRFQIAGRDTQAVPGSNAAFSVAVQPILERSCVSCHSRDGIGTATFALETAGGDAAVAPDLALVTGAGYMPPWPASARSVEFEQNWSLSESEVRTIASWASGGGHLDVPDTTPLHANGTEVRSIERDLVIPGKPYVGNPARLDDYHCQRFDMHAGDSPVQWLKSFTIEPDQSEIVHHASSAWRRRRRAMRSTRSTPRTPVPAGDVRSARGHSRR